MRQEFPLFFNLHENVSFIVVF